MRPGIQLFGCMKLYRADPDGFLERLRAAGYGVVEPCILFGDMPPEFGWRSSDVELHAARLKRLQLELSSAHLFAADFSAIVPELIETARRVGIRQYVVGYSGPFEREAAGAFARKCKATALQLAEAGIELWLHNSWREIAARIDGMSAYEWILRRCDGELGAQVDTGWVVCGGEALRPFLERNRPFLRSIHHKDVAAPLDADGQTLNVPLGAGIVDTRYAFSFGQSLGLGQIVDQDHSAGDFLADLTQSARFLRALENDRLPQKG